MQRAPVNTTFQDSAAGVCMYAVNGSMKCPGMPPPVEKGLMYETFTHESKTVSQKQLVDAIVSEEAFALPSTTPSGRSMIMPNIGR